MGSSTSQYILTFTESWTQPNVVPSVVDKPKHDPLEGFESGRQERVRKATDEDLYWAKIPPNRRDYCADHLIEYQRCRKLNYPFLSECEHYKHEWDHCQNEDTISRMKEFERERRLLKRDERKRLSEETAME
ncbi:NADH dehydrogenase [ubiquinone] 1 beta subcomplex subunit 7 [Brachionus plicatilis]|uniref:NADH dehydrogenase [ubiquinone] 1 beta subcomplex subunit 7 n=1 Tax=Brachionus plicatilis TaxID=10195 RepID=A0A3M7RT85_BRAPC|nr:NADH dehydrogenase [ubiquinone] 1 beta subcomplex subunit 7 [Brachionus plicatilis]